MRTIRVELEAPIPVANDPISTLLGKGGKIRLSTEAVVTDDSPAGAIEAGEEARAILDAFIEGYQIS